MTISLCFALSAAAGCATLKALGNPKAASAVGEEVGMGVVVRRAEAAIEVSHEVDRLLVSTPLDEDSAWLADVQLDQRRAAKSMDEASKHGSYASRPVRILPVEAWASVLPTIKSVAGEHASVLATIGAEVPGEYKAVQAKGEEFAAATAKVTEAQAKLDDRRDSLDPVTKDARREEISDLQGEANQAKKAFKTAKDALVDRLEAASAKATPAVRDKLGVVVMALRRAIDDARTANDAAIAGYPLAKSSLTSDVQTKAGELCADYIEEKTGTRPDMRGIEPTVTLDGLMPTIKLNGLGKAQLGQLDIDDVTVETANRTQRWMEKVSTLTLWTSGSATYLGFQADVLAAVLRGFEAAGWKRPAIVQLVPKDAPGQEAAK